VGSGPVGSAGVREAAGSGGNVNGASVEASVGCAVVAGVRRSNVHSVGLSAEPPGDAAVDAIAEGVIASGDGLIAAVHAVPDSAISDTAARPKSARRPRFEPVMSNPPVAGIERTWDVGIRGVVTDLARRRRTTLLPEQLLASKDSDACRLEYLQGAIRILEAEDDHRLI